MEILTVRNLKFAYSGCKTNVLDDISLSVDSGEFVTICGKSGCGKSTLLRHFKPALTPYGTRSGTVLFEGDDIESLSSRRQASCIGFVLQNPENQIVTDKVWHELAFGLESLGYKTNTIRLRVAEMVSFFGIQDWFMKSVTELSGGQKQLLNLASIMTMQPKMLLLDEPTSQLDPIASIDFLNTLKRINNDLGTTIIIVEHHLDDVLPLSDRILVMESGKIIEDTKPNIVGRLLKDSNNDMFTALPTPTKIAAELGDENINPVTVKEGRKWLSDYVHNVYKPENVDNDEQLNKAENKENEKPIIQLSEVWFKYEKNGRDIIHDLSLNIYKGRIHSIVGGNGTGKTTTLKIIAGLCSPYRGKALYDGMSIFKNRETILCGNDIVLMPQDPQTLFVKKNVELDLEEALQGKKLKKTEIREKVLNMMRYLNIESLASHHPYDLSGGEQQIAALAKVLLLQPKVLLLDEPTKGLDSFFKIKLGKIIKKLSESGVTVVIVSHDIDFCAQYSDICSMFFNGSVITTSIPQQFFADNSFYTTSANRVSRGIIENVINYEDVISLCRQRH